MTGKTDDRSVCCIGGTTMDRILELQHPGAPGTSTPVRSRWRRGGTARNVAENLARLAVSCPLLSVVGTDEAGQTVLSETAQQAVDTSLVQKSLKLPTASVTVAVEPNGDLFAAFADMEICASMDRAFIQNRWLQIMNATLVFADANLPADTLAYLIAGCREHGRVLVLDAVSTASARSLPLNLNGVDLLILTTDEARAVLGDDIARDAEAMAAALCQRGTRSTLVTAGAGDLYYAGADGTVRLPAPPGELVEVTGAGDALAAGILYGRVMNLDLEATLRAGLAAAAMTVAGGESPCPDLSAESITAALKVDQASRL